MADEVKGVTPTMLGNGYADDSGKSRPSDGSWIFPTAVPLRVVPVRLTPKPDGLQIRSPLKKNSSAPSLWTIKTVSNPSTRLPTRFVSNERSQRTRACPCGHSPGPQLVLHGSQEGRTSRPIGEGVSACVSCPERPGGQVHDTAVERVDGGQTVPSLRSAIPTLR